MLTKKWTYLGGPQIIWWIQIPVSPSQAYRALKYNHCQQRLNTKTNVAIVRIGRYEIALEWITVFLGSYMILSTMSSSTGTYAHAVCPRCALTSLFMRNIFIHLCLLRTSMSERRACFRWKASLWRDSASASGWMTSMLFPAPV